MTAGAAERRAGTGDLDKMGGLYRALPVTFLAAVIAALAISGVPPFNGFFSKWMVYQAVISMGQTSGGWLWIVLLVAAVFGSALTLASFVKVIHSVFLGQAYGGADKTPVGPKASLLVQISVLVLAGLCVIFGVWAVQVPLGKMIYPASGYPGALTGWQPQLATGLILLSIAGGLVIYLLGSVSKVRRDDTYVGGAEVTANMRYSAGDFYQTISQMPFLRRLYAQAKTNCYDLYDLGRRFTFYVGGGLRALHSGLLLTYVAWCVFGLLILVWFFLSVGK